MATIPTNLWDLLDRAFLVIEEAPLRNEMRDFARRLYQFAFDFRFQHRELDDNRVEHELVVLRQTLRIVWRSGRERASGHPFSLHELRVAVASAILHDLRYLRRITEEQIVALVDAGQLAEAERLRQEKAEQRKEHMRGSAEDAARLLASTPGLMTDDEIRQTLGTISLHDLWKLGWPYPLASDWLAVCCLEGDALFPLDPEFGPLADLQRKGVASPTHEQQRQQAASNLRTQLVAFRPTFDCTGERFQDAETIIRTGEGANLLREYRQFWGI